MCYSLNQTFKWNCKSLTLLLWTMWVAAQRSVKCAAQGSLIGLVLTPANEIDKMHEHFSLYYPIRRLILRVAPTSVILFHSCNHSLITKEYLRRIPKSSQTISNCFFQMDKQLRQTKSPPILKVSYYEMW